MNLYLDIETIPTQSTKVCSEIAASITPPSNMTKAETIAQWTKDKLPAATKEAIAKTAFDGALGHVCCVGYAVDSGPAHTYVLDTESSEADIIESFIAEISGLYITQPLPVTIIGHNVAWFDIRFLWQRAIVLGIQMPGWFTRDPKPWGDDVFDTMTAFAGSRGTIGLDRLAKALGLPGKSEIDGSMIGDLWEAGEYDKIAAYCKSDVELTREIHRKMMVAYGEAA